jgi:hypothetical protein
LSVSLSSVSVPSSTVVSAVRAASRRANDTQAELKALHRTTKTLTKKTRRSKLSMLDFERTGASEEVVVVERVPNVANVMISAGDEYERLGVDRSNGC